MHPIVGAIAPWRSANHARVASSLQLMARPVYAIYDMWVSAWGSADEIGSDMKFRHGSESEKTIRHYFSFTPLLLALILSACGGGASESSSGPSPTDSAGAPSTGPIALSVTLDGAGTVTGVPGTIECTDTGGVCSNTYASGATVLLTAAPAADYEFVGWSGAGSGCTTDTACSTTLIASQNVKANFRRKSYALTVALNGSGSVVSAPAGIDCGSDCAETYAGGTAVTLTAAAASGYVFSGWTGSDISCPGTGACAVTMNKAHDIGATFSPVTTTNYVLQVNRTGSGTVTSAPAGVDCGSDCSQSYASGTSVTLTATPAAGYTFSGWNGGGCSGTGACTVAMTMARSTTATFTAVTYTLSVSRTGSGSVTSTPAGIACGSDCSEAYASGTSVTLTATPASGYTFGGWGGACAGTSSCAVSMTSARNVTATFNAVANYTLAVTRSGSGTVISAPAGISCGTDCTEDYASGTSVTLSATAASGYMFAGWGGACAGTSSSCTVSMSAARSVSASFTATGPIVYQVSWDPVADARVTGYKLYYSTSPLTVTSAPITIINVGNVTSYSLNATNAGIPIGSTLYVAVTSVGDGLESEYSETVSTVVQ